MWIRCGALVGTSALLAACGTANNFSKALEEPVKTTSGAALTVTLSEHDYLKSVALGAVDVGRFGTPQTLTQIVCITPPGLQTASDGLAVFKDSSELVAKVAATPGDTSYAGYARQFRKNAAALEGPAAAGLQAAIAAAIAARHSRCEATFDADLGARAALGAPASQGADTKAFAPFVYIAAVNTIVKQILAGIEGAQREAAVRATVKRSIPLLEAARQRLADPPGTAFGPRVVFDSAPADIVAANDTLLGASLGIHRWYVAQQTARLWKKLEPCRAADAGTTARGLGCLADTATRRDADDFVDGVLAYRDLAPIDATKIDAALKDAIAKAEASTDASLADFIDALVRISDSLSGLADARDGLAKAGQ